MSSSTRLRREVVSWRPQFSAALVEFVEAPINFGKLLRDVV